MPPKRKLGKKKQQRKTKQQRGAQSNKATTSTLPTLALTAKRLRRHGRRDGRWRMQAQELAACKVGAAHSLAVLTSVIAIMVITAAG